MKNNKNTHIITYSIPASRTTRPSSQSITVDREDVKPWTLWLDHKNATYTINKI